MKWRFQCLSFSVGFSDYKIEKKRLGGRQKGAHFTSSGLTCLQSTSRATEGVFICCYACSLHAPEQRPRFIYCCSRVWCSRSRKLLRSPAHHSNPHSSETQQRRRRDLPLLSQSFGFSLSDVLKPQSNCHFPSSSQQRQYSAEQQQHDNKFVLWRSRGRCGDGCDLVCEQDDK